MTLEYTVQPITIWPEGWSPTKEIYTISPFSVPWSTTLRDLERELNMLGATDVRLQVDASPSHLRRDGQLRSDARIGYQGVILSFKTKRHGTLTYPCNAFASGWNRVGWQDNLRAIALGLEALRKVERYGIAERGQQYAGWAQIGMGVGRMTPERALEILLEAVGAEEDDDGSTWEDGELFRRAAARWHPDVEGGDEAKFKLLVEARDVLEGG
jgi:hypothetical protein